MTTLTIGGIVGVTGTVALQPGSVVQGQVTLSKDSEIGFSKEAIDALKDALNLNLPTRVPFDTEKLTGGMNDLRDAVGRLSGALGPATLGAENTIDPDDGLAPGEILVRPVTEFTRENPPKEKFECRVPIAISVEAVVTGENKPPDQLIKATMSGAMPTLLPDDWEKDCTKRKRIIGVLGEHR